MSAENPSSWDDMKDEFTDWKDYQVNKLQPGNHVVELMFRSYGKSSAAGLHLFLKVGDYKCSTQIKFWKEEYSLFKESKPGTKFKIESTSFIEKAERL